MDKDAVNCIWPEWHIVKQLGSGSFGTVYEAVRIDHDIESRAAVKIISVPKDESELSDLISEGYTDEMTKSYLYNIVEDFVREIRIMQDFKGTQNIVTVEDFKVVEKENSTGWDIYIRMELLTSFDAYFSDHEVKEEEIIKLGTDICNALELCESKNIIHRDIKPDNIFINKFGDFKLGDFGIARSLENLTNSLSYKGTWNYMAPEVAKGEHYDMRADIYSLGLVLYKLGNNNRFPFLDTQKQLLSPGERAEAVRRRISGEALPAPCNISKDFAEIILCACDPDPSKRFNNAAAMKNALQNINISGKKSDVYRSAQVRSNQGEDKSQALNYTGRTNSVQKSEKSSSAHPPIVTGQRVKNPSSGEYKKAELRAKINGKSKSKPGINKKGAAFVLAGLIVAAVIVFIVLNSVKTGKEQGEQKQYIQSVIYTAEEYYASEQYINAGQVVDVAIMKYPDNKDLLDEKRKIDIAIALERADNNFKSMLYESAFQVLDSALLKYPDSEELKDARNNLEISRVFVDAQKYIDNGDYENAISVLKNLKTSHSPDDDTVNECNRLIQTAMITQINSAIENGDYESAVNLLDELEADFENDDTVINIAENMRNSIDVRQKADQAEEYIKNEDYENAEILLEELEADYPEDNNVKKLREELELINIEDQLKNMLAEGDYENADVLLQEAENNYPANDILTQMREELDVIKEAQKTVTEVQSLMALENYNTARLLLDGAKNSITGKNTLYVKTAEIEETISQISTELEIVQGKEEVLDLIFKGDIDAAEQILQKLEESYPDDETVKSLRTSITAEQNIEQAEKYLEERDYEKAGALIGTLLNEYPDDNKIQKLDYRMKNEQAQNTVKELIDTGDYENAGIELEEALLKYPEDAVLTEYKETLDIKETIENADSLIQQEDYESAEKLLSEMEEKYPDNPMIEKEQEVLDLCKEPIYLVKKMVPYLQKNYNSYVNGAYFTMSEKSTKQFTDGFVLGDYGYAWFNLQGKYSSMELDVGGKVRHALNIYLEDSAVPVQTVQFNVDGGEEHIEVPLNGAKFIRINGPDYNGRAAAANIKLYSDFKTAKAAVFKPEMTENQYYLLDIYSVSDPYNCNVYTSGATFTMAGLPYTNGMVLHGYRGKAKINLDEEFSYLEFDIGCCDDDLRSNNLYVYLDDNEIESLHLIMDDISFVQHCIVDIKGAKSITFSSPDGYDKIGVANIILTK